MLVSAAKKVISALVMVLAYDIEGLFKVEDVGGVPTTKSDDVNVNIVATGFNLSDFEEVKKLLKSLKIGVDSMHIIPKEDVQIIKEILSISTDADTKSFIGYMHNILNSLNPKDDDEIIFAFSLANISVQKVPSITLSESTLSIAEGGSETLTATTVPEDSDVNWESSDESVATVTDGVITGVVAGNATIIAKIEVDNVEYSAECEVTVA